MEKIEFELSDIPVINLRREFNEHSRRLEEELFWIQLYNFSEPIELSPFKYKGLANDFLTIVLQRAILGVESYICAAVEYELTKKSSLSKDDTEKIDNPFKLKGRGTVENFYDKLPGLVNEDYKLSKNNSLYEKVKEFYDLVRNPIFHGKRLSLQTSREQMRNQIRYAFNLIQSIYEWIDTWYSAFKSEHREEERKIIIKDQ